MPNSLNVQFDDSLRNWSPKVNTGYSEDVAKEDSVETFAAAGMVDFPSHLWIEPNDWKEWAEQNDEYGTWPEDFRNRFTNQSPTHECTTHALLQNMEIAWNRQRKAKQSAVYLSALSVYAEANPRQWGGASVQGVMKIAMRRGMLPEHNGPLGVGTQKQLYKHTLNLSAGKSSRDGGSWVSLRNFPDGWEATAKHFKPIEVINIDSWEQHVCLVLRGICVSNGRSGHAIPHVKIVWRGGDLFSQYSDSYDLHRYDSVSYIRRGVGSAYGIVTTTLPDDWAKPAGEDMR